VARQRGFCLLGVSAGGKTYRSWEAWRIRGQLRGVLRDWGGSGGGGKEVVLQSKTG
jgi:hypothetical protein